MGQDSLRTLISIDSVVLLYRMQRQLFLLVSGEHAFFPAMDSI
jgi:hypothetical protein